MKGNLKFTYTRNEFLSNRIFISMHWSGVTKEMPRTFNADVGAHFSFNYFLDIR